MGVGVSAWALARAVSLRGQIGVVSGAGLDLILTRRLQLGDPGGHLRRALAAFPDQDISRRIIDRYFIAGGKAPDQPFAGKPVVGQKLGRRVQELLVAANFTEVFLAKEGHDGVVGINYLHKAQAPLLASLYGAMLAGVGVVIVGAGIPVEVPENLDRLARCEPVEMKLHVQGAAKGQTHMATFDPKDLLGENAPSPKRPLFFPIVSSYTLANLMIKKSKGSVDGLVIEGASAGGHNAPPRGRGELSEKGEPVYGPRDVIDLEAIKSLGLPFWLAGSYGNPQKLQEALAGGAAGIQVGTLFAMCEESGLSEKLKHDIIEICQSGDPRVFTDPVASPTGFPFKVFPIPGTLSDPEVYAQRNRQCDLGYLREAYEQPNGTVGWRCSAEEPEIYAKRGGDVEDTVGRKCICNSLLANIGLAQIRDDGSEELPLVTCGDDVSTILDVVGPKGESYTASDVIDYLLGDA